MSGYKKYRILNSMLSDFHIRLLEVLRSGIFYTYKPMFVEQMPIPYIILNHVNAINNLVALGKMRRGFASCAMRGLETTDGKQEVEQVEIINRAWQKLREKDNEIRNNRKLMDFKLADIVGLIKGAK